MKLVVACCLCALTLVMHGMARAASSERSAVNAEIKRLTADYAKQEAACRQQFVVTACVDDVLARKRAALAPLRAKLLALDDAERRQRAADRQAGIAAKRAQTPASAPPAAAASAPPRRPIAASAPRPAAHPEDAASRAKASRHAAAGRAADSARRRVQIDEDAERIRRRQAERELKGKKSAPLPVPGAASR